MLKGVRLGLLPKRMAAWAEKAFYGTCDKYLSKNPDGSLQLDGICLVAGLGGKDHRDGSLAYYFSEPVGEGTGGSDAGIGERRTIEELKLPEQMKRILIENNNREVYQMLGVEQFGDYVGGYLADTVVKAAASILLFAVVFILLHIAAAWLDLIARLPIIKGLNQIAGAVLGGVEGLMFLWIVCLVLTALSGTDFGAAAMGQVAASPWLSWLYDHNVISYFILGLVKGML